MFKVLIETSDWRNMSSYSIEVCVVDMIDHELSQYQSPLPPWVIILRRSSLSLVNIKTLVFYTVCEYFGERISQFDCACFCCCSWLVTSCDKYFRRINKMYMLTSHMLNLTSFWREYLFFSLFMYVYIFTGLLSSITTYDSAYMLSLFKKFF